ncbi:hypothetical protein AB3S75_023626 [Citrus x aurantiifolia]
MTRKKVKLAYISNDSARKATFKKRKKGLLKKVSELKTLCGIDACAIIFSPYDDQPEIWPSPLGVQRVLSRFKKMPDMEKSKKMVSQDSFLRQRIAKAYEQLKKQRKDNREKEMERVMFQSLTGSNVFLNMNMIGLNDLGLQIEHNIREICRRMETLNNIATMARPSNEEPSQQVEKSFGFDGQINMEAMQKQQWLVDLMSTPPQQHFGFGGEEVMQPFADTINNNLWPNPFYP